MRQNIFMLVLTLLMVAVTSLNHYTTRKNCELYLDGVKQNTKDCARNLQVLRTFELLAKKDAQTDKIVAVAKSEADRAFRIEGEFNDLAGKFVRLNKDMNKLGIDNFAMKQLLQDYYKHVKELYALMTKAGIKIPEFPGSVLIEAKPAVKPKAETGEKFPTSFLNRIRR